MKTVIDLAVPSITFCLMVAIGLDLSAGELAALRHRPRLLLAGLLGPPLLLPLFAVALLALFSPPHEIGVGLLLVAAAPIGGISTSYSYLARAAVALSLTLTALSCLLAPVTLPAAAALLERLTGRALGFEAPAGVLVLQVLGMLGLPVAIGMALRRRRAASVERLRPALQRAAFAALALVVGLVLASDFESFAASLGDTVPLAALFIVGSFALGAVVGRVATRDSGERFTLAAEFATRNLAVAVAVAVTLLGNAGFSRFASTYFLLELPILLGAIAWFRRNPPERELGKERHLGAQRDVRDTI